MKTYRFLLFITISAIFLSCDNQPKPYVEDHTYDKNRVYGEILVIQNPFDSQDSILAIMAEMFGRANWIEPTLFVPLNFAIRNQDGTHPTISLMDENKQRVNDSTTFEMGMWKNYTFYNRLYDEKDVNEEFEHPSKVTLNSREYVLYVDSMSRHMCKGEKRMFRGSADRSDRVTYDSIAPSGEKVRIIHIGHIEYLNYELLKKFMIIR